MAPTKALFLASTLAGEMIDDIPPHYREDPDVRAVIYAYAKETELKRARIDEVRRQFFPPTADVLLGVWEATLKMTVEPVGKTIPERQALVGEAFLRALSGDSGEEWEEALLAQAGAGTTYEEFDPQVPSNTVPPYTIRITVPFAPSSDTFARLERTLGRLVPANTDIILQSGAGFLVDISQLDQETFGGN